MWYQNQTIFYYLAEQNTYSEVPEQYYFYYYEAPELNCICEIPEPNPF